MIFNETLVIYSRYLLILVMFCAVWGKLNNRANFCTNLTDTFRVSGSVAMAIYCTLLMLEAGILAALLYGNSLQFWGFLIASVTFALMTLVILVLLLRHQVFKCNCFGESNHNVNYGDVIRNTLLLTLAVAGFLIDAPSTAFTTEHLLLLLAALPVAMLVVYFSDIYMVLSWRENQA